MTAWLHPLLIAKDSAIEPRPWERYEVLRRVDVTSGGKDRNHWIENAGKEPAVFVAAVLSK
jgi:hypothetical protein